MTLGEIKVCLKYPYFNFRQAAVLFLLGNGKMLLRDISYDLHVPRPSVSRAFDALERNHLIIRQNVQGDKRDVCGAITEKGREFLERMMG